MTERQRDLLAGLLVGFVIGFLVGDARAQIPREAERYRRDLVANARAVWGLSAPVATFAAQVHQESGWRPHARSKYAAGLAQFTPATADWIGNIDPALAGAEVFNPGWALRALVRYDRHLWERTPAATACDRMAFALAGYNGGEGWIRREQRAASSKGLDPQRWWAHVEAVCVRAAWACEENRGYPQRILRALEERYAAWGARSCG